MSLPQWLIKKTPKQRHIRALRELIDDPSVHTVCESAKCPNIGECYSKKIATFMILGDVCTRHCRFCGVSKGLPHPIDRTEPKRVAKAAKKMELNYVVVTSVTRDDLSDKGAGQFAGTINEIKSEIPNAKVEALIPDMGANESFIGKVIDAGPVILNHNVEMVPRLYESIRPGSDYTVSLKVLEVSKRIGKNIATKSGFMLGLGETEAEVHGMLRDLASVGCDIVTIGQYLRPSQNEAEVVEYVRLETFERYKSFGLKLGFKHIEASPFARSSYNADRVSKTALG